jgi:hypothetical protein
MIEEESSLITYEIIYRVKHGKKVICAYRGSDKNVCKRIKEQLSKKENIRYLAQTIIKTHVTLFD